MRVLLSVGLIISFFACNGKNKDYYAEAEATLKDKIIIIADSLMHQVPLTVTDKFCERSAGTKNDYYSEGDYWWPDPQNPEGAYVKRDGLSNPDNFIQHRLYMHRLSNITGTLASAYLITGNDEYVMAANRHFQAWFIDSLTFMNPSLNYSQAIKGVATGRKVGVIDGIHLVEVARAMEVFKESDKFPEQDYLKYQQWFGTFLSWLVNHPFGIEEMKAKNNHATTWVLQVAVFARFTENEEVLKFCKDRFVNVLLPGQMEVDGSFPLELKRTKPYGYSLFNMDAMAMICQILSDNDTDLWNYSTGNGKTIKKGIEFIYPFVEDKSKWPYQKDVMYFENWPIAHPFLLLASEAYHEEKYYNTWKKLDHFPDTYEVIRNLPVRNPLIWFNKRIK